MIPPDCGSLPPYLVRYGSPFALFRYNGRPIKGKVKNLIVNTIGKLAEGLEIDAFELFAAA